MAKRPTESRNWCFTLNNYDDVDLKKIDAWHQLNPAAYIIYGKETAESGTKHLQGYIHLPKSRTMAAIKKIVPKAHIEKCKGTPKENIEYCSKEGDVTTYGVEPKTQQEVNKDRAKRFIDLAKAGDFKTIEEEMPSQYVQQYRTMQQIATDNMKKPDDLDAPCGVWITGETGCGKTTAARTEYGSYFMKPANKWWDGYQNEDCVIIEDMDPNHSKLAYHIKLWTDKWSFTAEVKGGTRSLRPKKVIITSQYTIAEVFGSEGPEAVAAIERRCKVIHMFKDALNTSLPVFVDDVQPPPVITEGMRRMFMDIRN